MSGASFGVVLRDLRQRAGWTIEELAEASGVSVRAIGDMERGHSRVPRRRTVAALADGLGLADAEREALVEAAVAGRPKALTEALGATAATAVPPRSVRDFTGRVPELARLREAARRAGTGAGTCAMVVSGPPGCGKTTLALRAAADLGAEFPDGCLLVDLHGVDGPVDPGEAQLRLLKALGVSDGRLAAEDTPGRAGLLRALLAERRCLVVLDNARDEAQVRALLPASGSSLVLVTSRRPLTGLEDVDRLALAEMTQPEAVELLRAIIGAERADAEAEAVAQVAQLCGCLPLALRVAANWLTVRSGWSVDHLVRRLADEERRLGALTAGDVRVEAAFELSYRQLTAQAARMMRLLSLAPGPDFTSPYGAALTGTDLFEAEDVLEELLEAGLLRATFAGRYQLHDLLRLFARQHLAGEESRGEREAAEGRLRSWLLDTAVAAGRWFTPDVTAPPPPGHGLVRLETAEQARAWLESETPAWYAALRNSAARGEHRRVVETAGTLFSFGDLCPCWGQWTEVFRLSSEAATALADPRLRAVHLNHHAWALGNEHRFREAVERTEEALALARRAGDICEQARALVLAGWPHKQLGQMQERYDKVSAAVDLFEAAGDHVGWLNAVQSFRACLRDAGRTEEALGLYERTVAFLDAPDCPVSGYNADYIRARAICGLGRDVAAAGRWREAADHSRGGLLLMRQLGFAGGEAEALIDLGRALIELGETAEARSCFREALAVGDAADSRSLGVAQRILDSLPAE
ncbi:ATP-binding protein [Streptacidiphilus jiangxiensis]|uniref:NB-ARC domain-containing protein n=1 Tax=Streptacidiphilus jiangxiensis TaxID=235985 RepID=A0A1H7WGX1_STRJI|nr:XRE family transcriptional regulator [Streptacidiphilus jiangxiensis]SEM20723.1 NB-ARC domain-containing protein [Streptacidiphilus jiangxiensis]